MSSAQGQKSDVIAELISEFRTSGNHDDAFDNLAAQRLGVNETDLHCLNIIQNSGGVTAGRARRGGRADDRGGHRRDRQARAGRASLAALPIRRTAVA